MANGKFIGCVGLSMAIHTAVFVLFPSQMVMRPAAPRKPLEVSYQQTVTQQPKTLPENKRSPLQTDKRSIPEFIKNEIFKAVEKPFREEDIGPKKSVHLPNIPGETFKTPEYKSYYQVIREKIRKYAYFNYKRLYEGEVFLSFSLTPSGEVMEIEINDSKSSKNEYLRDIALRSVKEGSPYPEFPQTLKKNDKLAFNVIISFELK